MSGRVGSITTDIIADGLVLNMDAANRASTIPSTSTNKTFNTINLSNSGSFVNDTIWDNNTPSSNFDSFAFDGTTDYIISNFQIGEILGGSENNYTINVWYRQTDQTSYRALVTKWYSYYMGINGTSILLNVGGGSGWGTERHCTTSVANNTWINATVIRERDRSTVDWYLNGVFQNAVSDSTTTNSGTKKLYIGGYNNSGDYDAFQGNIGPIQMYNRALSSTEVLHNYNALKDRFNL